MLNISWQEIQVRETYLLACDPDLLAPSTHDLLQGLHGDLPHMNLSILIPLYQEETQVKQKHINPTKNVASGAEGKVN